MASDDEFSSGTNLSVYCNSSPCPLNNIIVKSVLKHRLEHRLVRVIEHRLVSHIDYEIELTGVVDTETRQQSMQ